MLLQGSFRTAVPTPEKLTFQTIVTLLTEQTEQSREFGDVTLCFKKNKINKRFLFCVWISEITHRPRGVCGAAGRQEVVGVAAGSFIHPAGGEPVIRVTGLFPATSLQSPEVRHPETRERYALRQPMFKNGYKLSEQL